MKIIAISGHALAGKDTVGYILSDLLEEHGHRTLIFHYADLLKYICKMYFNWDGSKDEQGRTLLQYVGTDVIRAKNPDYWVDFAIDFLQMFKNRWDYVIIPDTRFPNEIDKLKEAGFDVTHWRVIRNLKAAKIQGFSDSLTKEQRQHPSETALDNIIPDRFIVNDGTIGDLEEFIIQTSKTQNII